MPPRSFSPVDSFRRTSFATNFQRAFRHRDFRLLWIGAFLSFTGSWVQNIAQGWLVFDITHSETALGLVSFFGMAPVSILGPFAGTFADTLDRRKLLIVCQSIFGASALVLAAAIHFQFVTMPLIYAIALINGIVGAFEMPARQSVISRVVPPEDLPSAVPINAMTFNFARVAGPAIGGILLQQFGAQSCYMVNGLSYIFLIFSALAIKTDLSAVSREPQPIGDLLFEGMRFTFRDARLKTLFIMESIVSAFGLVYLSQMPAFTQEVLRMDEAGLGFSMTMVGIGAIVGLIFTIARANSKHKGIIVLAAMFCMAFALFGMAILRGPLIFLFFAIAGGCAMIQFNTTNALFQTLSPPRLRGRVIAMHVWALAGMGPFGALLFGWIAQQTKTSDYTMPGTPRVLYHWFTTQTHLVPDAGVLQGIPLILVLGSIIILAVACWGYVVRDRLRDLTPIHA